MKRRIGLLWGYLGTNYKGIQYNESIKEDKTDETSKNTTLEHVLLRILYENQLISEENKVHVNKIKMKSASRTDKGVSALFNLTICKINQDVSQEVYEKLAKALSTHNFILYKVVQVPKMFVAHRNARSREYKYFIPLKILKNIGEYLNVNNSNENENIFDLNVDKYNKSDEDVLKTFNQILSHFKGVHSFHNFTNASNEGSCTRNIRLICANKIVTVNDTEYVEVFIHGDSFIIHQIRKMMMISVLIFLLYKKDDIVIDLNTIFDEILFNVDHKLNINKAPGEFLYLYNVYFPDYNERTQYEKIEVKAEEKVDYEEFIQKNILTQKNIERWNDSMKTIKRYKEEYKDILDRK